MGSKRKTYTFEDWKEGRVPPLPDDVASQSPELEPYLYWTYNCKPSRMEESEAAKIWLAKKKAYLTYARVNAYKEAKFFFWLV